MKDVLNYLIQGNTLSREEACDILSEIATGKFSEAQVASFITVFLMRKPDTEEFIGFREALLNLGKNVDFSEFNTIDIVGTGGDGKNSFNISTLSCFVVAGAGYKVAKHGNYSSSSVSGSSNVLENLGYSFSNDEDVLKKQLDKANITFLHAPLFHPSLKNVAQVRRNLGLRSIFNLLGPVVNPSKPKNQMLGVYSREIGELYNSVLSKIDLNYSIVNSADGYDEISLTSDINYFRNNRYKLLSPGEFGFEKISEIDLYGGESTEKAAKIFKAILELKGSEGQNNVVVANAAIAINTISTNSLSDSVELARESLLSGKALNAFKALIR